MFEGKDCFSCWFTESWLSKRGGRSHFQRRESWSCSVIIRQLTATWLLFFPSQSKETPGCTPCGTSRSKFWHIPNTSAFLPFSSPQDDCGLPSHLYSSSPSLPSLHSCHRIWVNLSSLKGFSVPLLFPHHSHHDSPSLLSSCPILSQT